MTDKGYITLDKPFYAIEPSQNALPNAPYIAPLWTNLVYVNYTEIKVNEKCFFFTGYFCKNIFGNIFYSLSFIMD